MNHCTNANSEHEFYIVAFSMFSVGKLKLFSGILIVYLLAVFGNLTIILLVCLVPKLHTPMYFFLCNLAIVDITSTSTCIPKLLAITMTQDHRISFPGCMIQMFFFMLCAAGEAFTLTSMAYDRYVAVCKPLQYYTIMRKNVYVAMAAAGWIVGAVNSLSQTILSSILQFCNSHDIHHFFCDLSSVISLSTSDITSRKIFIFFETAVISILQFLLTIISYIYIFSAISKIRSSAGRMKAFSSCTSHLITVILFYGPLTFLYMKPQSEDTKDQDMLLSMLYLAVVPMLNPLVYSLRNKEVLGATVILFKEIKLKVSQLDSIFGCHDALGFLEDLYPKESNFCPCQVWFVTAQPKVGSSIDTEGCQEQPAKALVMVGCKLVFLGSKTEGWE
ncbi:olfactory receptor 1G1-like [Leptodactylus fuscus]|uniref:olfactory receptor 1G1-like n=1 Tax=Leptodactylus fuscus TaxID=238119 RepID=UPI003F4E58E0